jgi:hypothetical protein
LWLQLKRDEGGVRCRLIAASCALLSASAGRAQETPNTGIAHALTDWSLDSALAYYHEDGRVQAIEPVVSVSKAYDDGASIGLNLTFDALSGASPNGASPSSTPQTFASPSGKSLTGDKHTYTTAPGKLPEDPHYSDLRVALGTDWTLPLQRLLTASFGAKLSYEDDFYSGSVNASIARDFNQKNTTLSLGVSYEADSLHPIGGSPVPLSNYAQFEKTGNQNKDGAGLVLSLTQVMNRNWLSELNLSLDRFTGYLNDPYKIISVIDASGDVRGYIYENRPDSRTRRSLYLDNRVAWERSSAGLSLRYMTDDWGVRSKTAQLHLRWWNVERDKYVQPTLRWYRQSAADFYTPWLFDVAAPQLSPASADSRLAALQALTYGLKYGIKLRDKLGRESSEFNVRIEYYQQTQENRFPGPGALRGLDLYPDLKAILVQVGFSY